MKNWIPKNKAIVSAITMAVISTALYLASLSVVLLEIKKIENAYNDTESSSSRHKRSEALKSIAEVNKEYLQTLRDFFVHKGDEVRFIEQIEDIARKSSVAFEISTIEVKPGQTDAFREDVSVGMKIQGSWSEVMDFLDTLDKIYFGVSVQSVSLDLGPSNEWAGPIEFVVSREK